ncbi:MAG TPA: hypothetical protein PLI05_06820 [Methanotrichaceae archaeon]|nr:hypothetical protein [Methanotrichaceae archaeon]HQI91393.1 hypothetical protein [Methanotrichaceae archaeon]
MNSPNDHMKCQIIIALFLLSIQTISSYGLDEEDVIDSSKNDSFLCCCPDYANFSVWHAKWEVLCQDDAMTIRKARELYNKSRALMNSSKCQEALKLINQSLEFDPESSEAWNLKGAALACIYSFDEAISCYERSIGSDSSNPRPYSNMATSLMYQKRYDEALEFNKKATELLDKLGGVWWPW